jgi:quinol-cytochrome oxidoreductase complex cytochrome b subunit
MRNARGSVGSTGVSTTGIGEAPSSRLKKFGLIALVFFIALFIVMDFVDRGNRNKPSYTGPPPTAAVPPEG